MATSGQSHALRIRTQRTGVPAQGEGFRAPDVGSATQSVPVSMNEQHAFASDSCEHRFVTGGWDDPGRAVVWVRLRLPVVAGEEPSAHNE